LARRRSFLLTVVMATFEDMGPPSKGKLEAEGHM